MLNSEQLRTTALNIVIGAFLGIVILYAIGRPEPRLRGSALPEQRTVLILDIGHGGFDRGGIAPLPELQGDPGDFDQGPYLREHALVFDIASRMIALAETHAGFLIRPVVENIETGFRIDDSPSPPHRGSEKIASTPPLYLRSSSFGYRLKVYLRAIVASIWYRSYSMSPSPPQVYFMSLHIDSRPPDSPSGMIVYAPDRAAEQLDVDAFPPNILYFEEAREYSARSRFRGVDGYDESLAWSLAARLVRMARDRDVRVSDALPIRSRIRRSADEEFVPAVLSVNEVPARVLVELGSLSDPSDQLRIQTSDYRQSLAELLIDAVLEDASAARSLKSGG